MFLLSKWAASTTPVSCLCLWTWLAASTMPWPHCLLGSFYNASGLTVSGFQVYSLHYAGVPDCVCGPGGQYLLCRALIVSVFQVDSIYFAVL